ncbi:hypothetical protein [Tardiphaga sp.]|uniref:hypothetical protein n=1 Tax=Tardiphaga sp. TaxID=1926292 RepID=UPI0026050678|nr:hypothetical protein [Tardiphaga sp.]MDB5620427.1 hypothetical protein [Tardiphaga sp.]
MSDALLVQALVSRLKVMGYESLVTPFRVATVEFQFTAALRGRQGRALDLVLVVDTSIGDHGDREPERVKRRVEALSRALDVTGSRYVLTVILAGAALAGNVDALSETCRVLNVEGIRLNDKGQPENAEAAEALDDQIRVLLPLDLKGTGSEPAPTSLNAMAMLGAALPADFDPELLNMLVLASAAGEDAVETAIGGAIDAALATGEKP